MSNKLIYKKKKYRKHSRYYKHYKFHYVYRITNLVTGKHYYGKRSSNIHPLLDLGKKYFSSSTDLDFILDQKLNPQNYSYKVILVFSTPEEAVALEEKLHSKFDVKNNDSFYNKVNQTSSLFDTTGKVPVRDPLTGETMLVDLDDPRFLNGELEGVATGVNSGKVAVRDKLTGENMLVDADDPRFISGELEGVNKGRVSVRDKVTGETLQVDLTDHRFLNGELEHVVKGKVSVKDKLTGENMLVDADDPRFLSGELVGVNKGKVWINHPDFGNKRIPKDELDSHMEQGWVRGRTRK